MEFLTAEEKASLEQRLADLIAKRPEISQRIAEARALGDLKENADYHAAREDQGMMEADIRDLERRLSESQVVDTDSMPDDVVFVGATVRMKDLKYNDEDTYRLVGESTGGAGGEIIEVTATSPMGEAMMKARVGEVIKVSAPRGEMRFEILEIL